MINKMYHETSARIEPEVNNCQLKSNGELKNKFKVNYIKNPYINEEEDVLYHLMLSNKTDNLKAMFHDVKVVCMGGTAARMKDFAYFLIKELGYAPQAGSDLPDLTAHGHRYSMFKVGCVLCVNHGMGLPSITVLLHELVKLMQYANVQNPIFVRTGTSGGIDVPAGTVVIANEVLNDFLEPYLEVPVLGKRVKRPAILDQNLVNELKQVCEQKLDFPVSLGTTMSNEHFYESTAMKSGAICEHSDKDRHEYYNALKSHNVLNMDMEATALAAITHQVGIRSAVINVVSNDCFTDTEDSPKPEQLREWTKRPQRLVAEYIKRYIL